MKFRCFVLGLYARVSGCGPASLLAGLVFGGLSLVSCEREFTPNAEWREVPSVYCLMDQDDDTVFVRLQRCYLGDGNMLEYGMAADSIYYPADAVEVLMRVWRSEAEAGRTGVTPLYELRFERMMRDKVEGAFASGPQPVYFHRNAAGEMNPAYTYELVVRRTADGATLASATTRLLGNPDATRGWLISPSRVGGTGRVTFNMLTGSCLIKLTPLERGRLYQPRVRFYYRYRFAPDSLRYTDVRCDAVRQTSQQSTELTTSVYKEYYLGEIAKALAGDTNHKMFVDTVAIIMDVANEPLNAYIAVTTAADRQNYQMFGNIEGGVGVFGARRCHLMEHVLADKGDQVTGMHTLLENLGVGFQQNDL